MTTEYSFIKHIPVVIVMSVSHVSRYAMSRRMKAAKSHRYKILGLRLFHLSGERKIPGYNYQSAAGRAITGNRDNDTPVRS